MSKTVTKIKPPRPTRSSHADRVAWQLRRDVLLLGFEAAATEARLRGHLSGSMCCPLCQQPLEFCFDTFGEKHYFRARCATPGCIDHME